MNAPCEWAEHSCQMNTSERIRFWTLPQLPGYCLATALPLPFWTPINCSGSYITCQLASELPRSLWFSHGNLSTSSDIYPKPGSNLCVLPNRPINRSSSPQLIKSQYRSSIEKSSLTLSALLMADSFPARNLTWWCLMDTGSRVIVLLTRANLVSPPLMLCSISSAARLARPSNSSSSPRIASFILSGVSWGTFTMVLGGAFTSLSVFWGEEGNGSNLDSIVGWVDTAAPSCSVERDPMEHRMSSIFGSYIQR